MNDKIKEYKERINWNVWSDITSTNNYVIPEKDKIIKVTNQSTVKCDNDHPVVWYSLEETGFAVCGYCNIKYVRENADNLGDIGREWEMRRLSEKV